MPTSGAPSNLRKRLDRRAQEQQALINDITPKRLLKSPSQKKSDRDRKKFLKRAGINTPPEAVVKESATNYSDCRGCTKCGPHGWDPKSDKCTERSTVTRCSDCHTKVRVRVVDGGSDKYLCPVCSAKHRVGAE